MIFDSLTLHWIMGILYHNAGPFHFLHMLMFINRYPNAGIKSLSEKVMSESEYFYAY